MGESSEGATPKAFPKELDKPIDQLWEGVKSDWTKLAKYFPLASEMPTPGLILFNRPGDQAPEAIGELGQGDATLLEPTIKDTLKGSAGGYLTGLHSIAIDQSDIPTDEIFRLVLTEEEVHAASRVEGTEHDLKLDDFEKFDGLQPGFGKKVVEVLRKHDISIAKLDIKEFFPPIGQAYLLRDNFPEHNENWVHVFMELEDSSASTPESRAMVENILQHFPRLAGELLVKQYGGDIDRLFKENPHLLHMTPSTLWRVYIEPLLIEGSI